MSDKARPGRAAVAISVLAATMGMLPWLLGGPWWEGPVLVAGTAAVSFLVCLTICWVYEWPRR